MPLITSACGFLEVVLDALRQSAGCGEVHWMVLIRLVHSILRRHAVSGALLGLELSRPSCIANSGVACALVSPTHPLFCSEDTKVS